MLHVLKSPGKVRVHWPAEAIELFEPGQVHELSVDLAELTGDRLGNTHELT